MPHTIFKTHLNNNRKNCLPEIHKFSWVFCTFFLSLSFFLSFLSFCFLSLFFISFLLFVLFFFFSKSSKPTQKWTKGRWRKPDCRKEENDAPKLLISQTSLTHGLGHWARKLRWDPLGQGGMSEDLWPRKWKHECHLWTVFKGGTFLHHHLPEPLASLH